MASAPFTERCPPLRAPLGPDGTCRMLVEPVLLGNFVGALCWAASAVYRAAALYKAAALYQAAAHSLATASASAAMPTAPAVPAVATTMPAVGWLTFVLLIGFAVLGVPILALLIRRALPARLRERPMTKPMTFGVSPKVSRSPRHAVLLHRSLIVCLFLALTILLLIPGVLAVRTLGLSAIRVGLALVLPILLVTLHVRRRGQGV